MRSRVMYIDREHDPYVPASSWWLDHASREAFAAAVAREALRMKLSKQARKITPMVLDWPLTRRTALR